MTLPRLSRKGTAACVLAAALLFPAAAHGGIADILSLFQSITGTLSSAIGPALADLQAVEARVAQLEQRVVWPEALISQTRSSIQQLRGRFSAIAGQIHSLALDSATLAAPSQLEKLLRASLTDQFDRIAGSYRSVFQALPAPQSATAAQRSLLDIDDASALSALKIASASDAAGEQQLALADGMEQQAAAAAPGSAPLLAAQAQVAQLQSQAMLHRLLAAQLRQEAALLAHDNALRKQGADSLGQMRGNLLRLLNRH
jgi:hypothetical protein